MLRTITVNPEQLQLLSLSVEPKLDFETQQQKTGPDGPVWTVSAVSLSEGETLKISVAAASKPELSPGAALEVRGLRAGAYVAAGRAAFYWTADSVA